MHTPNGLCFDCQFRLQDHMKRKENPRKLRITTGIDLGKVGQGADGTCACHICWLGHLWGAELNAARAAFRRQRAEEKQVERGVLLRRCNSCFSAIFQDSSSKHTCVGKKAVIENLKSAIPRDTRLQLALETLREVQVEKGDSFHLQSIKGGKATTISLGSSTDDLAPDPITLDEAQKLGSDAHLNGGQLKNVMANLRAKFGRSFAESGLDKQLSELNGRFLPFFTCERTLFEKDDDYVRKPFFFCNRAPEFLKEVARLRGEPWEQITLLVQGDSGQQWFKLAASLISSSDLLENERDGKRRRRADGMGAGTKFKSYGVRKIQILALVQGAPESSFNLHTIFRYIQISPLVLCQIGGVYFQLSGYFSCAENWGVHKNPGKITQIRALSGQFSTNARISDLFGRLKYTDTRSVQKDKYPGIMHHQIFRVGAEISTF